MGDDDMASQQPLKFLLLLSLSPPQVATLPFGSASVEIRRIEKN
jgi:hypothetical protein